MISMSQGKVFLIAGMHRSGTSALCAALHNSGVHFGDQLLEAMEGVNDEGFWEDSEVVSINDSLLAGQKLAWFLPLKDASKLDWTSPEFDQHRQDAGKILERGFGGMPAAIKDPRFCLTLPFWLDVLSEARVPVQVIAISRPPSEIARSLNKRDGLPLSYGLRLVASHQRCLEQTLPEDSLRLTFDSLIEDTDAVMSAIGLNTAESEQASAVRADLRHYQAESTNDLLDKPVMSPADAQQLYDRVDRDFPLESVLADSVAMFVERGVELSEIGAAHTQALATLDQRDADIDALSVEHKQALATIAERDQQIADLDGRLTQAGAELETAMATIDERDEQIAEFDRRLGKLGDEHSHALEVLRERDAQLDRLRTAPGIGLAVRWILSNEKS